MNPNVVMIVLDTLREDYSSGLGRLTDEGFVRYENCLTTATWTLPAHASMLTGLMPSLHYAAYGEETLGQKEKQTSFRFPQAQPFPDRELNLLRLFNNAGYETYGLSCNPYIPILTGSSFKNFRRFDAYGDVTEATRFVTKGQSGSGTSIQWGKLLRGKRFGLSLEILSRRLHMQRRLGRALHRYPLEKGSKHCVNFLKMTRLAEPCFVFVNIMEAHDPYNYADTAAISLVSKYCSILGKPYPLRQNWGERYQVHANLAITRTIEMLQTMKPLLESTLVIVTSDHGQMIGEMGKYGHGFFLDDELLKVPLYIRYPPDCKPFVQVGKFLSLAYLPTIVKTVMDGGSIELGRDTAVTESFGPASRKKILPLAKNEEELRALKAAYAHKIKVYSTKGNAIYNKSLGLLESVSGSVTEEEVRRLADALPTVSPAPIEHAPPRDAFAKADELTIREHLRDLGYE